LAWAVERRIMVSRQRAVTGWVLNSWAHTQNIFISVTTLRRRKGMKNDFGFTAPTSPVIFALVFFCSRILMGTWSFSSTASVSGQGSRNLSRSCRSQSTHRVATATFWRIFHHDGKISWWGWGVNAHPPLTIFTITYKVAVYAQAERADTLPLFHLYPYVLYGAG
jgi:hypothetical protein